MTIRFDDWIVISFHQDPCSSQVFFDLMQSLGNCFPSFPMVHRKKYLTEGTSVTSYIVHLKLILNQVWIRRMTLCNEKSNWPAGCCPATQSSTAWPHNLILNPSQGRETLKIIPQKTGVSPWFIPLLFKALSSWEVAGCNILNSASVRQDTLSQIRTIIHFN